MAYITLRGTGGGSGPSPTPGLTNLPVSNADSSIIVLATSLRFFNSTVAPSLTNPSEADITPTGGGGLPVTSPNGTILVTTTPTAQQIDIPQSVATSATPSFAGLNIAYNTPQVSILQKMLNFFAKSSQDAQVVFNQSIRTSPLTANRTLTLPDNNSTTVVPTGIPAFGQVLQYIGPDGIQNFITVGTGGTVGYGKLIPLIITDATTFLNTQNEGVGNTVLYTNNDASLTLPVGTFIGFLGDPNAYLITTVVVVPPVSPATIPTTTITIATPLKVAVQQFVAIYKYRITPPSAVQTILFDDGVIATNANGNLYIQSKYKPIFGTNEPNSAIQGYFGQFYLQDVSIPTKEIYNLWVSITPDDSNQYTWVQVSGSGGGGTGATFGTTSVFAKWLTGWITYPNIPAYIATDSGVVNRYGVILLPLQVTTNLFSENTGSGTINGIRYIGSEQEPADVNKGNGIYFPQSFDTNTDIVFELITEVFTFTCQFVTPLTLASLDLFIMISDGSIVASRINPINKPILFLQGPEGEEQFYIKRTPQITVSNPDAQGYVTVTLTDGIGVCRSNATNNWVGSTTPYYIYVAVADATSTTNACTGITPVQLSSNRSLCSYTLETYITPQGNTTGGVGPTPSGGTITSASLTISPTATGYDIEVPARKAIPFYNTATPGLALASIGTDGTLATTTVSKTTNATSDPVSTGGIGTPTVGNPGDSIYNTNNGAWWLQTAPLVVPPVVQTYNWVRVNTSPTPPPVGGVTLFNTRTGPIVVQAGTNATFVETPNGTFTINNTATGPANPLVISSGLQLPTLGNNGDLYLYLNQSATPYILLQKSGNVWASNNVLSNMAQNNTVQLFENQCLQDLFDAELYPDLNVVDNVATILDNANTTFILSYINLYVTVVRTALSDTDVGILNDNLISGQVLQADGAGTIGTWRFIITAVNITGISGNKTATILGHLKTSDTQSLTSLNTATGVIKSLDGSTLRFNGAGLFTDCFVPDLDGNYLGWDPFNKKITYLALPTPPPITKVPTDIQTFYLSVDGNGQAGTILFDTVLTAKTQGTAFGTMSNGVFTASRAVKCTVNITFNLSGNPAGYGTINNAQAGTRYNEFDVPVVGALKMPVSQIVPFASGDNYRWNTSQAITVFGGLTLGTTIEFKAEN